MRAATLALALAILTTPTGMAHVAIQDDDLDVVIDRLAVYLEKYEADLGSVMADERYTQLVQPRRGMMNRRDTDAEVMFLRIPSFAEWLGVRDIKKVDGRAVAGVGTSLADLQHVPAADFFNRAALIMQASARHQLSGRRTFTMPTVTLEALSVRNHPRYEFALKGKTRIKGVAVRQLEFHEFAEPTLVESPDGAPLWMRGTAWVEPASGTLWRAEITVGPDRPGAFRQASLESQVRVDFARDAQLPFLVPVELSDSFWMRGGRGLGRARYSNFRPFRRASLEQ